METYNGNDIFAPFNAGLYGIDDNGERSLDEDASKISILAGFKEEYRKDIEEALKSAGLALVKLEYYSPKFYNFATDSLDITISLENQEAYLSACEKVREDIQARLDANKSYDGYMALTADTFEEAVEKHQTPVITALLAHIDFSGFDKYDYLEWNYACEACELIHEDKEYLTDEEVATITACEAA